MDKTAGLTRIHLSNKSARHRWPLRADFMVGAVIAGIPLYITFMPIFGACVLGREGEREGEGRVTRGSEQGASQASDVEAPGSAFRRSHLAHTLALGGGGRTWRRAARARAWAGRGAVTRAGRASSTRPGRYRGLV